LAALLSKQTSHVCTRYNTITLLSVLAVYAHRDLYPLATYTKQPADKEEGQILYVKLAVLCLTAVVIPLFTPRIYTPVDPKVCFVGHIKSVALNGPKNPIATPNPEQTASWISRITFSYMDAVILLGTKVAHLRHDQLPPLRDDDYAQYQTREAFSVRRSFISFPEMEISLYCNSTSIRSVAPNVGIYSLGCCDTSVCLCFQIPTALDLIFMIVLFSMVLGRDYVILGLTLFCSSICSFAAPIGINQTLRYVALYLRPFHV
jgi:hypothetical protein